MSDFKTLDLNRIKGAIEQLENQLCLFNTRVTQVATELAEYDELYLAEQLLQIAEGGTHLLADLRNIETRYDWRWKYGLGVKNAE